jgi:glutamyl-tRNA(Gln) amidotransferase subunit E
LRYMPNYSHIDYCAWGLRVGMKVLYQLLPSASLSDESAINDAITIALMLNCRIVEELTGGIIGVDGWVPLGDKHAHIAQVALARDAISSVQIATNEAYHHPLELETIALNIARAVWVSGKVQVGNRGRVLSVSIAEGTTTEIIGMPRIKYLPPLAHYEAIRQRSLLDLRDEMLRRGLAAEDFAGEIKTMDISGSISGDKLQQTADEKVNALVLPGMKGLGEWETGPGRNFAREINGWLKAVDTKQSGSIVWDEALQSELLALIGVGGNDAVLVITGDVGVEAIMQRCAEACRGIPREVRRWLPDGTTEFVCPLPDVESEAVPNNLPAVKIAPERVAAIRAQLPPSPFVREQRWLELGLHPELVRDMLGVPPKVQDLFDAYLDEDKGRLAPVAHFLSAELKAVSRTGLSHEEIETLALARLLDTYREGRIANNGLAIGLWQYLTGGIEALEVYLDEKLEGIADDPEGWGRREVNRLREEDATAKPQVIMAQAMARLMLEANGKVEGARLAEAVRVALEQ